MRRLDVGGGCQRNRSCRRSLSDSYHPKVLRLQATKPLERAIMSPGLIKNLPEALKTLRTQPLFVMRLNVRKLQIVGATPGGYRRVGVVPNGSFEGARLCGE